MKKLLILIFSTLLSVSFPSIAQDLNTGKWGSVKSEISPIDDSESIAVYLDANSAIKGWPQKIQIPKLIFRCKENKTEVFIYTGMTEAGDTSEILIRFDKHKAFKEEWGHSTDNRSVFLKQSPISFIKKMMTHKSMLFQITPFNSSPTMTTFDLTGLEKAIKPLQKSCNWETGIIVKKSRNQDAAERAIKKAFYNDRSLTKVNGLKITVRTTGFKSSAREIAASFKVQIAAFKIKSALGFEDIKDWHLKVTAHGSTHKEPTSSNSAIPYTSKDLATFAKKGLQDAGIPANKYTVHIGEPAKSKRWGKTIDTNEHVIIEILGI